METTWISVDTVSSEKPDGNYIKIMHVKIKSKYSAFSKSSAPNPFCSEAWASIEGGNLLFSPSVLEELHQIGVYAAVFQSRSGYKSH